MNFRPIITALLFTLIGIVTVVFVRGCAPVLIGPRCDTSRVTGRDVTAAEKKVAWQKMQKWRSIHRRWFDEAESGSTD